MLSRLDWTRILTILLSILAALALLYIFIWMFQLLLIPILMLLVAWMLSYVLNPMVDFFDSWGIPRGLSALFVYLLVVFSLGVGLFLLITPLTAQANALSKQIPLQLHELLLRVHDLESALLSLGIPIQVNQLIQSNTTQAKPDGGQVLGTAVGVVSGFAQAMVHIIITLVLSFYLVLDSRRIGRRVVRLAPEQYREKILFAQSQINRVVGGYLRAQLLTGITIGVLAGVGCWILGVPYPLIIGLLAGMLELIPMVGPILAAVPALLIAAFQPFPLVLWVLLYFLAVQQLETHIIVPRLAGHAVGIHPLGALLALVIGTELGGLWGAIFAVPAAGVAWVFAVAAYHSLTTTPVPSTPRQIRRMPPFSFGGRTLFRPPHPPANQTKTVVQPGTSTEKPQES